MPALFVDPGEMRAELALQESVRTDDELGGFSASWSEVGLLFGKIEPVAAESVFAADQTLEQVTHRITMRWRGNVRSGMRLSKRERVFDILTVHDPDDTGRYLVCRVKEQGL